MIFRIAIFSALSAGLALAVGETGSGRAEADWIAVSATVRPGQPLQTAIRIRHEDDWHSYWLNPGEAGMATTVEWKLPPGWKHGETGFPVPIRFLTGELAGYGYEGTVLLPVTLIPPDDFAGKVKLEAVVSWLACSDEGCVPGEAALALDVAAGDAVAGPDAAAVLAAIDQVPRPAGETLRLDVEETENSLILTLTPATSAPGDLSNWEAFPLTPELVDPKAQIRFAAGKGSWGATVAKSEFATSPVKELSLVMSDRRNPPLMVTWKIP